MAAAADTGEGEGTAFDAASAAVFRINAGHGDLVQVDDGIAAFQQQGLVSCIATVHGVERFDANTAPHVHFICDGCEAVIDLHKLSTPQSLCAEAENSIGCSVGSCQLSFTGKCRSCLEAQVQI